MPAKQRQIHYIEADKPVKTRRLANDKGRTKAVGRMIEQVSRMKRPYVIENALRDMSEGNKVYILTYARKSCEQMAKELDKAVTKSREWSTRMRSVKAKVWAAQTVSGTTPETRFSMAQKFRDHEGAGAFVATIDSMPGSLSLRGATVVHMADFHHSPSAMEQAEDRPFEPGSHGPSIIHYVVKGSFDEHLESVVIPKFETKDALLNDESSREYAATFSNVDDDETLDQLFDRLCAGLDDE